MALKFNSEEEAREWLKKVKSAGAAPAKSETLTLDQVLNDQPPEPPAAPAKPPEPVRAAPPRRKPEPPSFVDGPDEPAGQRERTAIKIVEFFEAAPWVAVIGWAVSWTLYYRDQIPRSPWTDDDHVVFWMILLFIGVAVYVLVGLIGLAVLVLYAKLAPGPKHVPTEEEHARSNRVFWAIIIGILTLQFLQGRGK